MSEKSNYIVQYVGFKTNLNDNEFILRWTPFATEFKNAGIKTIDLYKVIKNDHLTFISRNVWDEKNYFKNFPSGIASDGSSGGIKVTQFGGYWLAPEHSERRDKIILAFLTTEMERNGSHQILRLSCSKNVPYRQMLEIVPTFQTSFDLQLNCEHLKQL